MFGTGLNYVALRILGIDAEHPVCVKARATLHKLGILHNTSANYYASWLLMGIRRKCNRYPRLGKILAFPAECL